MSRKEVAILVCGLAGGALISMPFTAPLFGAVLPDAAATMWGAALGALFAVGGAFWLQEHAHQSQRREFGEAIDAIIEPLQSAAFRAVKAYHSKPGLAGVIETRASALRGLAEAAHKYRSRISEVDTPLEMIGYTGKARLIDLDTVAARFADRHADVTARGTPPSEQLAQHISGYEDLKDDAVDVFTVAEAANKYFAATPRRYQLKR